MSSNQSKKYSFDSFTKSFKRTPHDDPRTLIQEIVGDDKQPSTFFPQVKFMGWNNEANFSMRVLTNGKPNVSQKEDKILFEDGKYTHRIYAEETGDECGGVEFDTIISNQNQGNILTYTLQTKGVDLYRQGELTEEEILMGANRPENVIGSYAVYARKSGDDISAKNNYKTGKIAHIYRPFAEDANGNRVWCNLDYDPIKQVIYLIVPYEFIDSAAYPIRIDPTLGYTSVGASTSGNGQPWASTYTMPADSNAIKISVYGVQNGGSAVLGGLYNNAASLPSTLYCKGGVNNFGSSASWKDSYLSGEYLKNGTVYWITSNCGGPASNGVLVYYDSIAKTLSYDSTQNYTANTGNLNQTWTSSGTISLSQSLYLTYDTYSPRKNLQYLNYTLYGSPFVPTAGKTSINLELLDYNIYASPFAVNNHNTGSIIAKVASTAIAAISKVSSVLKSAISKISSVPK